LVSASLLGGNAGETADYGASFVAVRRGRTLLVEASAVTPQTSRRLEEQVRQLRNAARVYMGRRPRELEPLLVLACPGVLRQPNRAAAAPKGLQIWDGPYLRAMAGQLDVIVPPGIAWGDEDSPLPGYDLVSRLAGIRPGAAGWPAYEKYCQDLLSFLFVPPLNPPIPQSRDERHANRRDYILPNYAADYLSAVLGPLILFGGGIGMSFGAMAMAATHGVPVHQAGLASGLLNTTRQVGGAIGLAVMATAAASLTKGLRDSHGTAALTEGYKLAFLIAGLGLVTGMLLAFALPTAARQRREEELRAPETAPIGAPSSTDQEA
jgi:hypothetical protein